MRSERDLSEPLISALGRSRPALLATLAGLLALAGVGCDKSDPVITYTIPTTVPAQLRVGADRMLAAMLPRGDDVWFYKVTGPEKTIEDFEPDFRKFVEQTKFEGTEPALSDLPENWRRGADKPMRFASIDVETPTKQLDVSISKLGRQSDWDDQVKMNVNRWRGQLGLPPSDARWAEAKEFSIDSADAMGVWVDLLGKPGAAAAPMTPPFADRGRPTAIPPASGTIPPDHPPLTPRQGDAAPNSSPAESTVQTGETDDRIQFDRPSGWRDGRMSSMRLAAFNIGPADAEAELTVIAAGGDLRGNVARWLGQIRGGSVADDVVDQALADARSVKVSDLDGQRFLLSGDDSETGNAIDATIVPLDNGASLFIKMTGPAKTVAGQTDAIDAFLKSLRLKI